MAMKKSNQAKSPNKAIELSNGKPPNDIRNLSADFEIGLNMICNTVLEVEEALIKVRRESSDWLNYTRVAFSALHEIREHADVMASEIKRMLMRT